MELGAKLRQARLEAGLSQRQLCGEKITRNMLSQIENGSARPSMDTLRHLAGKLGKPVSYFLEEDAVLSPNREVMLRCREAYMAGDCENTLEILRSFREPDEVYGWERTLIEVLATLDLAEKAAGDGRAIYARELLDRVRVQLDREDIPLPGLKRRRLLLLLSLGAYEAVKELPSLDGELLLRAKAALEAGNAERAEQLLDAAEDKTLPQWGLLRGRVWLTAGDYSRAIACLNLAEEHYPRETAPLLELCHRELGDFRQAYNYACKSRSFL